MSDKPFRVPEEDASATRRLLSFELPLAPVDLYAALPTVLRGPRGLVVVERPQAEPEPMLVLYEFESCPFCRKVREVLCELDLAYESRPCARGSRHREELRERGGKVMVPYLVDAASGVELYESDDIIAHLWRTWVGRERPTAGRLLAPLEFIGNAAGSVARPLGRQVEEGAARRDPPAEPLELWNIEASPYCRLVREALCALDLPARVYNVAKKSARRKEFRERWGRVQVPLLHDPNRGETLIESAQIVRYLHTHYGA